MIRCKIIGPSNPRAASYLEYPRPFGTLVRGIFVFQYLVFLGLTIWDEVVYQTGNNTVQTILAVQRGMTANILNIAASAYAILEGVMLAHWLRERDKRKEQEAVEEAIKARQAATGQRKRERRRNWLRELPRNWPWNRRAKKNAGNGRPV